MFRRLHLLPSSNFSPTIHDSHARWETMLFNFSSTRNPRCASSKRNRLGLRPIGTLPMDPLIHPLTKVNGVAFHKKKLTTMDGIKAHVRQAIHYAMSMAVKNEHVRTEEVVMDETGSHRCETSKAKSTLPLQKHTYCKTTTPCDSNHHNAQKMGLGKKGNKDPARSYQGLERVLLSTSQFPIDFAQCNLYGGS